MIHTKNDYPYLEGNRYFYLTLETMDRVVYCFKDNNIIKSDSYNDSMLDYFKKV